MSSPPIRSRRARRGLLGAVLLCLLTPAVRAQGETVGKIEEMKRGETPIEESTADVRLTATPAYVQRPARTNAPLHLRELIEVLEPTYVRALLDYGGLNTQVVAGSSGGRGGPIELHRRGAYEILPGGVDTLTGLELRIRHGVITIEHNAGRLGVWVKDTFASVFSTVLFAVDSTSASSLVYLREGRLEFPQYDVVVEEDNSAWRLVDGAAPERLVLPAAALQQLQRETDFLAQELWAGSSPSTPFYRKPEFFIPAGVAVGAAIGVAIYFVVRPADTFSGDAIVRIPD